MRYARIFSVSGFGALIKTAGCPDASADLVANTVQLATKRHESTDAGQVLVAALTNPATGAELVADTLKRAADPVSPTSIGVLAPGFAAVHHHAATDPQHWWQTLAKNLQVRSKLCDNLHVPAWFLAAHADEHPVAVARNPNTGPATLAELLGRGIVHPSDACANPHISDDLLAAAMRSDNPKVRIRAYSNPRHTRTDLQQFRERELRRDRYDPDVTLALTAAIGADVPADPYEVTVVAAVFATYRRDVAATVNTLDSDTVDAAATIVSAGFFGTVGELYAVAAAVTQ